MIPCYAIVHDLGALRRQLVSVVVPENLEADTNITAYRNLAAAAEEQI